MGNCKSNLNLDIRCSVLFVFLEFSAKLRQTQSKRGSKNLSVGDEARMVVLVVVVVRVRGCSCSWQVGSGGVLGIC